jgi:hypothetical protein
LPALSNPLSHCIGVLQIGESKSGRRKHTRAAGVGFFAVATIGGGDVAAFAVVNRHTGHSKTPLINSTSEPHRVQFDSDFGACCVF